MKFAIVGSLTALALVLAGCSSDESDSTSGTAGACAKDTDCPGQQLCSNQVCVDPGSGGASSSGGAGSSGGASSSGGTGATGATSSGGSGGSSAQGCTDDAECGSGEQCFVGKCMEPGRCDNPADTEAAGATYERELSNGTIKMEQARDIARNCGVNCLFDLPEPTEQSLRDCTHACIQERVPTSDDCTSCLVVSVECGRTHCLNDCVVPENPQCFPCVCGENSLGVDCVAKYEVCAGIPSTTCDGL